VTGSESTVTRPGTARTGRLWRSGAERGIAALILTDLRHGLANARYFVADQRPSLPSNFAGGQGQVGTAAIAPLNTLHKSARSMHDDDRTVIRDADARPHGNGGVWHAIDRAGTARTALIECSSNG
jgi:hypothetical protein